MMSLPLRGGRGGAVISHFYDVLGFREAREAN